MNYIIKTAPTTEPILLAEAQGHCRSTDDTAENTTMTALIIAAREYCELFTRRALAPQTIEMYLDCFTDEIKLLFPPITTVTSIKYKDYLGIESTWAATNYVVDTVNNKIVLAYGKSFPAFTPYSVTPITITYTCGYTTCPRAIKQAMLLLIGHWYENRASAGEASKPIEYSVKNLLALYKAW